MNLDYNEHITSLQQDSSLMSRKERTSHLCSSIYTGYVPIAAPIKFKALMFAYRTTSCSASLYLKSLLQTYMPSRSLRSASERRITVPSQRDTKSLSQTFTLTVPIWWNDLPNSIRAAESLHIFKKRIFSIFIWPSNSSTLYSKSILSNLSSFYLKKNTFNPLSIAYLLSNC